MNKAELILEVQKQLGKDCSKAEADRATNAVLESIKKGLKKDKGVTIVGFGSFTIAKRKAREGVNPQTGEKIKIPASKAVKFKAGKGLKEHAC